MFSESHRNHFQPKLGLRMGDNGANSKIHRTLCLKITFLLTLSKVSYRKRFALIILTFEVSGASFEEHGTNNSVPERKGTHQGKPFVQLSPSQPSSASDPNFAEVDTFLLIREHPNSRQLSCLASERKSWAERR